MADMGEFWVFGYGSLMWRPGFDVVERATAHLTGYHRCFCITSVHHRGSGQRPRTETSDYRDQQQQA